MKNSIWNSDLRKRILTAIKNFFITNLAVKIVALLFAVLLWGYVLTDQNPYRTKTITNVNTSFEGEAELLAQGLCVRGDRSEILGNVTVQVRTQIVNYAALGTGQVNATISLRNISEARVYELPVTASVMSGYGVVEAVTPSVATVEIDTLVIKSIPVSTKYVGTLPDGYWADMNASSVTTRVEVQGAKKDMDRVKRAECIVDWTGCTSMIYSTFDIVLYDEDDNVISSDIVVGTLPSSTVRIPIYPMKEVPIDVAGSLIGADNLAANHELYSATATPSTVHLIGEQSVLDDIDSIPVDPINISGKNDIEIFEAKLILPEGVRLLEDSPTVSISVDIRESTAEQLFEQVPIEIIGLDEGLTAYLGIETVDLRVMGRTSLVSILKRSDVKVQVDVTNLSAGEYDLNLFALVRDEETTLELTTELTSSGILLDTVHVTIRPN